MKRLLKSVVWLALAAVSLSACSSKMVVDDISQSIAKLDQFSSPMAQVEQLEALLNVQPDALTQGTEERFDIAVDNVEVKSFFASLVAGTGKNIAVHPDLRGKVSLQLKDVNIDEVLNVVRDIYGYDFRRKKNIYTIFPRSLQTQVFTVNYLDVIRTGVSDTRVSVAKIGSGQQSSGANARNQNQQVSGTRVKTESSVDFWRDLESSITTIIGGVEEGRSITTNAQAGMVVVKALPRELSLVKEFLHRSELSVKRQVILETKIIEVQLNDSFSAGINWSAINGQLMLSKNATLNGPNIDTVDSAVGEVFSSVVGIGDISNLLSLLQTQGTVQVLSSPRVSTVNNQKALIRVGSDEFFVTGVSNSTTSNASSTINTPNLELTSFFSGIALDVTPQIAESGDVILHVHPVVSAVKDQTKNITVGDQEFSLPLAFREVRESDSIVRAQSGQVVVLGGLMTESYRDSRGRRPLAGDIPAVGQLFRSKQYHKVKSELVILMKPIVIDADTWRSDVDASQARINKLSNAFGDR